MSYYDDFIVRPGKSVALSKMKTAVTGGFHGKREARKCVADRVRELERLQYLLYAEGKHAVLIVLQAMDAGGKDGTIRHVMSGVNPQGCDVTPFKVPTPEELAHDFLWRIHKAVPRHGRSASSTAPTTRTCWWCACTSSCPGRCGRSATRRSTPSRRRSPKTASRSSSSSSTSRRTSSWRASRDRIDDAERNWKVSAADFEERKLWGDYTAAYEDALSRTSTAHAPWFVIPADHKWFRDLAVSEIICETLRGMKMRFPPPPEGLDRIVVE